MARLGRALLGVWLTTLLSAFGSTVAVTQVESDIFNNPPAIIPGAQCPGTAQKWSNLFPDTVITSTPSNNNGLPDILIEADQHVVIDKSFAAHNIEVLGCLVVDCSNGQDDLLVHVHRIDIYAGGYVSVGTKSKTCKRVVDINIFEAGEIKAHSQSMLTMKAQYKKPWTHLVETVYPNSNQITVAHARRWFPGDKIVITTTDINHSDFGDKLAKKQDHTEVHTIQSKVLKDSDCDEKTSTCEAVLTLEEGIQFKHYGQLQYVPSFDGPPRVLDERAEVALLDRHITVRGVDCLTEDSRTLCATTRFLKYAVVQLWNVAFDTMGHTMKPEGQYAVHFHNFGDADGLDPEFSGSEESFVRQCVITNSMSRGLVLHGVTRMEVNNNVVYNIEADGFFLEDGYEEFNELSSNLAINCKTAFWITNMNNVFVGNVAVGSNLGFDINVQNGAKKDPKRPYPQTSRSQYKFYTRGHTFGRFEKNKAHSCVKEGFRQWEKFAAKVNCYCTPLPDTWTAQEFYGRDNIQECSYDDCEVNVDDVSIEEVSATGVRRGYSLYTDLTLYANGWPTFSGLAYNAHALMFPGLIMADQCNFLQLTSIDGQGPSVFSDMTYVRSSLNIDPNVAKSKWGSHCNKDLSPFNNWYNGQALGAQGAHFVRFSDEPAVRAWPWRGCVFDRIVMLGAEAEHAQSGQCDLQRFYVENDSPHGPWGYLNIEDVPAIKTTTGFAPFPLLATPPETDYKGYISSKFIKGGNFFQHFVPELNYDWMYPLKELGYSYEAWSELKGWDILFEQDLGASGALYSTPKTYELPFDYGEKPGRYNKLTSLQDYKGSDNMYTLMLKWPSLYDGKDVVQIWKQENNPIESCYPGFTRDIVRMVAGSDEFPQDNMHWTGGLGSCNDGCLLSRGYVGLSSPNSEFCVGLTAEAAQTEYAPIMYQYFSPPYKFPDVGTIPAHFQSAQKVQLYALKDEALPRVDDMSGFTKVFGNNIGRYYYATRFNPSIPDQYFEDMTDMLHKDFQSNHPKAKGDHYWEQYSMLDLLEGFRDPDGMLEFKLIYHYNPSPGMGNKFGEVEWFKQDTNPLDVMPGGCANSFEGYEGFMIKKEGAFCGFGRNRQFTSLLSLNRPLVDSGILAQMGQPQTRIPDSAAFCLNYREIGDNTFSDQDDSGCRANVALYVRSKFDTPDQCAACLGEFHSCAAKCLTLYGMAGSCVNGNTEETCCNCYPSSDQPDVATGWEKAQNLVQNPSFEEDSPSSKNLGDAPLPSKWEVNSNSVVNAAKVLDVTLFSKVQGRPWFGDNFCTIKDGGQIKQDIAVQEGAFYQLVFYYQLEPLYDPGTIEARVDGTLLFSQTLKSEKWAWVYFRAARVFQATSSSAELKIRVLSNPDNCRVVVDDISVAEMKTVPVYGYFSGAKQDHMYGLSYEAPAGYVPQGYAFSLFSDGDFAGSTPLYSSRRVNNQGSPVGGINADTTVGVVPMQANSTNPEYRTTDIIGYCHTSTANLKHSTAKLTRYHRVAGLDHALVLGGNTPDLMMMDGFEFSKDSVLCHTPIADPDAVVAAPPSPPPAPPPPACGCTGPPLITEIMYVKNFKEYLEVMVPCNWNAAMLAISIYSAETQMMVPGYESIPIATSFALVESVGNYNLYSMELTSVFPDTCAGGGGVALSNLAVNQGIYPFGIALEFFTYYGQFSALNGPAQFLQESTSLDDAQPTKSFESYRRVGTYPDTYWQFGRKTLDSMNKNLVLPC